MSCFPCSVSSSGRKIIASVNPVISALFSFLSFSSFTFSFHLLSSSYFLSLPPLTLFPLRPSRKQTFAFYIYPILVLLLTSASPYFASRVFSSLWSGLPLCGTRLRRALRMLVIRNVTSEIFQTRELSMHQ